MIVKVYDKDGGELVFSYATGDERGRVECLGPSVEERPKIEEALDEARAFLAHDSRGRDTP